MKKIFSSLFIILSLISCGELTGESTGANDFNIIKSIGDLAFVEVGDSSYRLEGTAANNGNVARSYSLDFKLPAGESVTFYLHAKEDLSGGLEITFQRIDTNNVKSTFSLNGIVEDKIFESGESVSVIVDMHNNESSAHILMWYQSGPFGVEECLDEDTCLFNTDSFDTIWGAHGKAAGGFWGVKGKTELMNKLEGPNEAIFDH